MFNDSHRRLQKSCKSFIDEHLNRHALEWDTMEEVPSHVFARFVQGNYVIPALPAPLPAAWLKQLGIARMPGDVPVEEWNALHSLIYTDEVRHSHAARISPDAYCAQRVESSLDR
jgi:acyl-CoA dehydrogenase